MTLHPTVATLLLALITPLVAATVQIDFEGTTNGPNVVTGATYVEDGIQIDFSNDANSFFADSTSDFTVGTTDSLFIGSNFFVLMPQDPTQTVSLMEIDARDGGDTIADLRIYGLSTRDPNTATYTELAYYDDLATAKPGDTLILNTAAFAALRLDSARNSRTGIDNLKLNVVPEPGTVVMVSLASLLLIRRNRR